MGDDAGQPAEGRCPVFYGVLHGTHMDWCSDCGVAVPAIAQAKLAHIRRHAELDRLAAVVEAAAAAA